MQRQPADCKQPHNDGQRLGSLDLFLQSGARLLPMKRFHLHQLELVARGHEDAQVDGQHQQQGDQHASEKVEVDHILHDHHLLEQAPHQAGRAGWLAGAVGVVGLLVPAHHGCQTDDDGQNPADGDDALCSLTCHQAVVPGGEDKHTMKGLFLKPY